MSRTFAYAATTKDEAERSRWTFYKDVHHNTNGFVKSSRCKAGDS
ncbi:MAG: hypothetical protein WAU61_11050 [Smithella sp.]